MYIYFLLFVRLTWFALCGHHANDILYIDVCVYCTRKVFDKHWGINIWASINGKGYRLAGEPGKPSISTLIYTHIYPYLSLALHMFCFMWWWGHLWQNPKYFIYNLSFSRLAMIIFCYTFSKLKLHIMDKMVIVNISCPNNTIHIWRSIDVYLCYWLLDVIIWGHQDVSNSLSTHFDISYRMEYKICKRFTDIDIL